MITCWWCCGFWRDFDLWHQVQGALVIKQPIMLYCGFLVFYRNRTISCKPVWLNISWEWPRSYYVYQGYMTAGIFCWIFTKITLIIMNVFKWKRSWWLIVGDEHSGGILTFDLRGKELWLQSNPLCCCNLVLMLPKHVLYYKYKSQFMGK